MKPGPRIRVAVVGAGVMGRHHAHNYLSLPSADLVAMVDPDPAARALAVRTFGCPAYASTEAMLADVAVDAASVVAPTSLHHRIASDLLAAGVHALVEKPVATSVGDATDLVERSRRAGLVLQVGHITRFYKAVRLLSERVHDPYLIDARRLTPHARIRDVGVILDLMIHDIDIVLGMVSSPIRTISVAGHTVEPGGHEDVASAQLIFENGCIARFLASRVAPDAERSLVVAERDRTYRVDFLREPQTEVAVYQARRSEDGDTHVRTDRHLVHEDNPLREELEHFLDRIALGAPPIGTLEDDLRSLRVATDVIDRLEPRPVPGREASPQVH
ncbi:MAG: Gfo/Idh/MocA family oxidoreductase [Trueperaceae bacterium]